MREGLLCVGNYGEQRGVRVLVEPMCHLELNNLNSVPETVAFVRSLGHPNLGIVADTFHMNIEDCCLPASLMAARDSLGHVHFTDSNRRYPGAGHVPFGEVVEALHLIGYDGFITIEVKQSPIRPWRPDGLSGTSAPCGCAVTARPGAAFVS
jgi:5-keto-L-gluconate epimerase